MEKISRTSTNAKLIISQYFDSLIRQIDIHTEETLQRFTDADVFEIEPNEPSDEPRKSTDVDFDLNFIDQHDPYSIWEKFRQKEHIDFRDNLNELGLEPVKIPTYVNQMRDLFIKELEQGQKEAFEYYKTIKDEIDESMSQEEIESIVFANNYYLTLTDKEKDMRPFKMYLVKLDFYLNSRELDTLG